ncbi:putative uncharacterized protein [Prevotella sp. CAG:1320]|nr:putative uncharacterized protein [Prevotella sp. CAG:1320]
MYTPDEFTLRWQRLHRPSMDVTDDAAFYWRLYTSLRDLTERNARPVDGQALLSLLLYTENTIAVGLDGVYEYLYRRLGNVVFRWCDRLGMDANATSQVHALVSEAVADASSSRSGLRRWMAESVLSRDFSRLSEMLVYFAEEDRQLRRVFPDLRYREEMFLRLTGDRRTAQEALWGDMAFCWRDKRGKSLSDTIAHQFRLSSSALTERERTSLREAAELLGTIQAERLDTYIYREREDDCVATLRHGDGRVFRGVIFPTPVPSQAQGQVLVAQLVTYAGNTYVCGPLRWMDDRQAERWNGEIIWQDIFRKEREAASRSCFTTPFGKRLSLYEDLYTLPEDPEEARLAAQGIYRDEPDVLDFLVSYSDVATNNEA